MSSKQTNYIIAVDLDDTLLHSNGTVSERTLNTLKQCKEKGFILSISSTRGFGSCKKIADQISADYVCCQAGNMIVDKHQNIIYKNPFKTEDVESIVETFSKHTDLIFVDSDFNLYGQVINDFTKKWGVVYHDTNKLKNLNAYKLCVGYTEPLNNQIMEYCTQKGFVCRKMIDADYMFITPANSNKFYALEQLATICKTNISNLVVFGDDHSDLLSIQNAGFGVAMKNSKPEIIENAKYITLSNDEDGVADFLEKHLL